MTLNRQRPADLYRRKARRLRSLHAGNPARLQRSLLALTRQPTEPNRPIQPVEITPARAFAAYLHGQQLHGILCYSHRLQLLATAKRLGINRFEANMIIATLVERGRVQLADTRPTRSMPTAAWVTVVLLIEAGLALGAWRALFL